MELFDHLLDQIIDDPAAVPARSADLDRAWLAPLLNTLVVDDRRLTAVDRLCDRPTAVTVVNSTGAGGITSLARRSFDNIRPTAVQTALRDPGDLAGNVARVAIAARELDPGITVLVDIPDGFGRQDAVAEAEASGLAGILRPAEPDQLAARLSGFVEADLPFAVDGIGSEADLISLMVALDAVIDGAGEAEAAGMITSADHEAQRTTVRDWDRNRRTRLRRRLMSVRVSDVAGMVGELADSGLVGSAT